MRSQRHLWPLATVVAWAAGTAVVSFGCQSLVGLDGYRAHEAGGSSAAGGASGGTTQTGGTSAMGGGQTGGSGGMGLGKPCFGAVPQTCGGRDIAPSEVACLAAETGTLELVDVEVFGSTLGLAFEATEAFELPDILFGMAPSSTPMTPATSVARFAAIADYTLSGSTSMDLLDTHVFGGGHVDSETYITDQSDSYVSGWVEGTGTHPNLPGMPVANAAFVSLRDGTQPIVLRDDSASNRVVRLEQVASITFESSPMVAFVGRGPQVPLSINGSAPSDTGAQRGVLGSVGEGVTPSTYLGRFGETVFAAASTDGIGALFASVGNAGATNGLFTASRALRSLWVFDDATTMVAKVAPPSAGVMQGTDLVRISPDVFWVSGFAPGDSTFQWIDDGNPEAIDFSGAFVAGRLADDTAAVFHLTGSANNTIASLSYDAVTTTLWATGTCVGDTTLKRNGGDLCTSLACNPNGSAFVLEITQANGPGVEAPAFTLLPLNNLTESHGTAISHGNNALVVGGNGSIGQNASEPWLVRIASP